MPRVGFVAVAPGRLMQAIQNAHDRSDRTAWKRRRTADASSQVVVAEASVVDEVTATAARVAAVIEADAASAALVTVVVRSRPGSTRS